MIELTLSCARIDEITKACLLTDKEANSDEFQEEIEMLQDGKAIDSPKILTAQGITMNIGFHKKRLTEYSNEIWGMLNFLPEEIKKGVSFLNLCMDKNGSQWGEHRNIESLLLLGIALDMIIFPLPKSLWSALPGSMPMVQLKTKN